MRKARLSWHWSSDYKHFSGGTHELIYARKRDSDGTGSLLDRSSAPAILTPEFIETLQIPYLNGRADSRRTVWLTQSETPALPAVRFPTESNGGAESLMCVPPERKLMEIVKYGHPALRWKSTPLPEITPELQRTVRRMFDLMYEARGIGLAANQVGLPYRLFIVNASAEPSETEEELVFINPEIIRRKGSEEGEEGCLSLPELYGNVPRAEEILVEAYDLNGEGFGIEAEDLMARVIQHENDHLDGVLFVDRMSDSARQELEPQLADFAAEFERRQNEGQLPGDEQIKEQLAKMETSFEFPE
jgi:peptide deformylase